MLQKILVITLVAFLSISSIIVFPAYAAGDLAVEFQMTPLFSNLNFMPGNSETRWVKVTNNGATIQKVITSTSDEVDLNSLAEVMHLIIKEGATTLYSGTMAQFFAADETYLTDLAPGATKQYDFTVSFDTTAGNAYQGKTASFTLNIGFQGGEQDNDGSKPIVKAKWEMLDNNGRDDSTAIGAQFLPSGEYQVAKTIKVCAIATDPSGVADINGVYGDVFYPQNVALGPNHEAGRQGCGKLVGDEFSMRKLSKADGIELFCNKVRTLNNNLPTFNAGYDYTEICGETGELQKDTAEVFCGEKILSYEDPSGDYRVLVMAQDKVGNSGTLENQFKYLDLTAFETDFTNIFYGNVRIDTHKIISGDLTWGNSLASVRNIGNTRLAMRVWQDDMGLGKTDGLWNVRYDGRIGSSATFKNYWPEVSTSLDNQMNLSELNEMDFSIDVFKFPPTHEGDNYFGTMVLSAEKAPHLTCSAD